jgi:hypothetical protein
MTTRLAYCFHSWALCFVCVCVCVHAFMRALFPFSVHLWLLSLCFHTHFPLFNCEFCPCAFVYLFLCPSLSSVIVYLFLLPSLNSVFVSLCIFSFFHSCVLSFCHCIPFPLSVHLWVLSGVICLFLTKWSPCVSVYIFTSLFTCACSFSVCLVFSCSVVYVFTHLVSLAVICLPSSVDRSVQILL